MFTIIVMTHQMSWRREWLATELPQKYRAQVINHFTVEFLNSSEVISTNNPQLDAAREGKKKNHVVFKVNFLPPRVSDFVAARISMEPSPDDVGSNEAVHAGSDNN